MKPINPRNYCQHGLHEQHKTHVRGHRLGVLATIVGVLSLLALLALANHWDATREAQDAALEQRVLDAAENQRNDQVWLKRMAEAYERGRSDALVVQPASPEALRLAMACASLNGGRQ